MKTISKVCLGGAVIVGGIVLAPVIAPAAAVAGTAITAAAASATTAIASSAVGTAVAGAATAVAGSAVGTAVTGATAAVGGVVTSAATAAAGTAVGSAVGATMATVGSAVGTAASAVGVGAVATVTNTTAGATAVGIIATSGTVGISTGTSGVSKMAKAKIIVNEANSSYEEARNAFDVCETKANKSLEQLGKTKLLIWNQFAKFEELFNQIHNLDIAKDALKDNSKLKLDDNRLQNIRILAVSAKDAIKGGVVSLSAGQLIGVGTSTGITSVATASTGTAIASLHGAAATKASLAALGGGAKAAGGLGIAGGTVVSGLLAAAPAIAIGGIFLNSKGGKSLKAANATSEEVEKVVNKLNETQRSLMRITGLSEKLILVLAEYKNIYENMLTWLEELVDREKDATKYTKIEVSKLTAMLRLTEILYDLTTKPLFSSNGDKITIHSQSMINDIKEAEKRIGEDVTYYENDSM